VASRTRRHIVDWHDFRFELSAQRGTTLIWRVKTIITLSYYSLFILGCCALGYYATVAAAATYYQAHSRETLRNLADHPVQLKNDARLSLRSPLRVGSGLRLLGRLDIPRIGLSAVVADGTSSRVLRLAVGRVPGTATPWSLGNVALAAHRDTFFHRLGELHRGDSIQVTVPGSQYYYKVVFTSVVSPNETWVLQPATGQTLTLITCYPFHFVGAAPNRFVVRARRVNTE
jgi:LPXTG-site transpeptidase (sortase) family protein